MKKILALIVITLFFPYFSFAENYVEIYPSVENRMDELYGNHKIYKDFFFEFKKYISEHKKEKVADLIEIYPMSLGYHKGKFVIKNKHEFISLYDAIFSDNMVKVIKEQKFKNLFFNSRGVMIGNGEIWFSGICLDNDCNNVSVKIISINNPKFNQTKLGRKAIKEIIKKEKQKLYRSLQTFIGPILQWKTKNYIIRIDRTGKNKFRYAAWNVNSQQSMKPDIILNNGTVTYEGSGGNHHYEFKNGAYKYICSVNMLRNDYDPPGSIEVYKNNTSILYEPVIEVIYF